MGLYKTLILPAILLVDDIITTGNAIKAAMNEIQPHIPSTAKIAVLCIGKTDRNYGQWERTAVLVSGH